ncbi:hypothetical protein SARC_05322 [Sphaeroforma arctica JP610]|uniref:Uncharacterized protein n=1 Tax=Sphaeroforma arctica JP610 TaxID=667725 RepID=A0A0L0FZZ9_9EUKA|nr:hypothetical protein SARC_05322 [Sphaeroforma arctica JP610]KNC82395.1 hypothetical protein SARC_05322 [Sphaeroforma arctica JP610]|eukprot:XP_014156297.1 hypothetical protein SARC_05322 [Sphaeroforma arctica JP610]
MTETTSKSNDKSVVDERRNALTSATGQTGSVSSTSTLSGLKVSECTNARPPSQAQRDTHKVPGASTTNTTASADKEALIIAAAQEGCKKQARLGSGHALYLLRSLDTTDNVQVPRTPEVCTGTVPAAARVSATEGDIHTSLQRISPAYTRRILCSADDSDGFSSDLSHASSDDAFDFVLGRAGNVSASHAGPGPGRVMVSGGRDTCTKVSVIDRNEHITGLGLAAVGVRNVVQEVRELKGSDSAKTRRSREEVRGNVSNMLITRKHACDDVSMKVLTRKEMSMVHESMDAGKSHTRARQPCVDMVNAAMSKKKSSAVITGKEMSKRHASTDVEIPDTPEQQSLIDVGEIETIRKQPCVKVKDDMIQEEASIDGAKNKMTGKQPFSDAAKVDLSGSQVCDYAATMKLNGEELCSTVSKTEMSEKHYGAHVVRVSVTKQQDGDVEIKKGEREKSTRQIVGETATGRVLKQKTSIDTIQKPMFQKPTCANVPQRAQVCIKVQTTKKKVRRPEVTSTNERVAGEAFSSTKSKVGGVKVTSSVQKVRGEEISTKGKVGGARGSIF